MTPAQVRTYYERGGDLRRGRGEHQAELRPRNAAQREVAERAALRLLTDEDRRYLRGWRETAPGWIPRSRAHVGDSTAAILSQIGTSPKNWRSVTAQQEGQFWRLTIELKRGYPREVLLADRDQLEEVGRIINQYSRAQMAETPEERRRLERAWNTAGGDPTSFTMDVYGS